MLELVREMARQAARQDAKEKTKCAAVPQFTPVIRPRFSRTARLKSGGALPELSETRGL